MIKFFTKYAPRKHEFSPCGGKSMTDPQYKDECDVNKILAKYGCIPDHMKRATPLSYGDVSECGDFGEMLEKVRHGQEKFMELPSDVRARFGNDPVAFFDFVSDERNLEEMVKLGLAVKKESEVVAPTSVTPKAEEVVKDPSSSQG